MRESKISYRRLVDRQEHGAFIFEDGINMFVVNINNQTCLNCGHTELTPEVKEILDPPNVMEKRIIKHNNSQHISIKKIFL